MDGCAVEFDGAAIGRMNAGEHFDERGFSRAVLAHQRMDFAPRATSSPASSKRLHAMEGLRDVACAKEGNRHGSVHW